MLCALFRLAFGGRVLASTYACQASSCGELLSGSCPSQRRVMGQPVWTLNHKLASKAGLTTGWYQMVSNFVGVFFGALVESPCCARACACYVSFALRWQLRSQEDNSVTCKRKIPWLRSHWDWHGIVSWCCWRLIELRDLKEISILPSSPNTKLELRQILPTLETHPEVGPPASCESIFSYSSNNKSLNAKC